MRRLLNLKIILGVLLFLLFYIISSDSVFAACHTTNMQSELTFDEAMEILGVTDTSQFNGNVIKLDSNNNARGMPDTLKAGNVYYEDMTISGTVTGRARIFNGDKFMVGLAFSKGSVNFGLETRSYDSNWTFNAVQWVDVVRPGDTYKTGFFPITWGQKYYLKYDYLHYGGPECTCYDSISFRVVIGVN